LSQSAASSFSGMMIVPRPKPTASGAMISFDASKTGTGRAPSFAAIFASSAR